MNRLLLWDVFTAAAIVASISAIYVTFGGQTSVIMTDLFQGLMLLVSGVLLLGLGIHYLGGFDSFWEHLPRGHRRSFDNFNTNPGFPSVGIFWQDAVANSAFLYFLNQGILMRFMATRSLREARKAAIALPLLLMPVAACVVAAGGWVARALVHGGVVPEMDSKQAFYVASEFLATPGVFGLILAALAAALMSTVDTLITAVSTIAVNDVYKPYVNPGATERESLRCARYCAVGVTAVGLTLVPVFASFETIYAAHGAMTAAVAPPLVVALLLAVLWPRYTATAAMWTILGGFAAIGLSIFWPQIITPFAHGVPMADVGDGLFSGVRQYKFMRALFGLGASASIGIVVSCLTRPEPAEKRRGLVIGALADALRRDASSARRPARKRHCLADARVAEQEVAVVDAAQPPSVQVSSSLAAALEAEVGETLYVTDTRWWLGGLNSGHVLIGEIIDDAAAYVVLPTTLYGLVSPSGRRELPIKVERQQ